MAADKDSSNVVKRGRGRPKGAKNRITKNAKEAFNYAFEKTGGEKKLTQWANSSEANYGKFITLFSKLIPVDLTSQEESIVVKELNDLSDKEIAVLFAQATAILGNAKKATK